MPSCKDKKGVIPRKYQESPLQLGIINWFERFHGILCEVSIKCIRQREVAPLRDIGIADFGKPDGLFGSTVMEASLRPAMVVLSAKFSPSRVVSPSGVFPGSLLPVRWPLLTSVPSRRSSRTAAPLRCHTVKGS